MDKSFLPLSPPKARIENFRDARIAGTQAVVDYFLFEQGGYPYTFDVTAFFRRNEQFSVGYGLLEEVIAPVIGHTLAKNPNNQIYRGLLNAYAQVLKSGTAQPMMGVLEELNDRWQEAALSLLEGRFLETPKETPLFKGKRIVVTGSDTGIGRATALEFARREAEVVLHYPTDSSSRGALSAVELISEYGGMAEAYKGDFRKTKEIYDFAEESMKNGIDILVNNAGITFSKPFEDVTRDELESIVNINLVAQYIIAQNAVKHMTKQGRGVIINMSSYHGMAGMTQHSAYAMTKAGIPGLTRELAIEFARRNIRVNAVMPGGVINERHLRLMPNFAELANSPIQHWNNPRDVARIIAYYCSDETKDVTGQQIIADCGTAAALTNGGDATKIHGFASEDRSK